MNKHLIHRRERIIISTIEVLDRVGIQNLSTRLIAQREGISEGTLFRHFKNKDEILLAVIDHFSQFDQAIIASCRQLSLPPLDCLCYFFNTYGEYHENYPEITTISQLSGALRYETALLEKIEGIIDNRQNFIVETINQAKRQKLIPAEIASLTMAEIILGGISELYRKWRREDFVFSIKEKVSERIEILIQLFTG